MIKPSEKRNDLKDRIKRWAAHTGSIDLTKTIADAAILETFFHIYNELEKGATIHDIGLDLGVLPCP